MKILCSLCLLAIALLPACAQTFPKSVTQPAGVQKLPGATSAPVPVTLDERRAALKALLAEIWEDWLRRGPEFASSIGDKRYNDQLSDYSVATYNEQVARDRDYIFRLAAIDTAGLSDQESLSKDLMARRLAEGQEEAEYKPWEMPVTQMWGPHIELPALVPQLTFESVKDYDDYTARLSKIPVVFQQISTNMMTGINDRRVPPKYILEKVLVQVNAIATDSEIPRRHWRRGPDSHQGCCPGGHFKAGSSRLRQVRPLSQCNLHSRRPPGPWDLVNSRRRPVLRFPCSSEHDHRSDARHYSQDGSRRGETQ